jgi:hypothetical protein
MCNAGNCDTFPNVISEAHLRYDCNTKILCILVKTVSPYVLQANSDNWYKDYTEGVTSKMVPIAYTYATVTENGKCVGWSACYDHTTIFPPRCRNEVEVHADWENLPCQPGGTAGTKKFVLDLSPRCPCTCSGVPGRPIVGNGVVTPTTSAFKILPSVQKCVRLSEEPVHFSSASQPPAAACRLTNESGLKALAGQAAEVPVHFSSTSQSPAAARHTVSAATKASPGQSADEPVHFSSTSQSPAAARHTSVSG